MVTGYQLHCVLCCVNIINLIGSTITRETNLWAFLQGHFYIGLIDGKRAQPNHGWYCPAGWSLQLQNVDKVSCIAASISLCLLTMSAMWPTISSLSTMMGRALDLCTKIKAAFLQFLESSILLVCCSLIGPQTSRSERDQESRK